MKYVIPVFATVIISCHSQPVKTKPTINLDSVDSPLTRIDRLKDLSDSIFYYVELADMKKINKKKLSKIADPLQKQFDSIFNLLSHSDKDIVRKYRTDKVNEMVDRKVERDN